MNDTRALMRRLYRGVDGFEIPKAEEKHVRASRGSPIYGELTPSGVLELLEHLQMDERDVFYDLGSGSGKVVLQTALTVPVRKCVGIELASSRVSAARRVLRTARRDGLLVAKACSFRAEDLLTTYLSDATVIYTCSTAFSARFLSRLVTRVSELNRSLRFVTLQELDRLPPGFVSVGTLRVPTTWTRRCEVALYDVSSGQKRRI